MRYYQNGMSCALGQSLRNSIQCYNLFKIDHVGKCWTNSRAKREQSEFCKENANQGPPEIVFLYKLTSFDFGGFVYEYVADIVSDSGPVKAVLSGSEGITPVKF